jgi:hypothetical protein
VWKRKSFATQSASFGAGYSAPKLDKASEAKAQKNKSVNFLFISILRVLI